jgi:hypothetical protein
MSDIVIEDKQADGIKVLQTLTIVLSGDKVAAFSKAIVNAIYGQIEIDDITFFAELRDTKTSL